jgi:hypothetical protein
LVIDPKYDTCTKLLFCWVFLGFPPENGASKQNLLSAPMLDQLLLSYSTAIGAGLTGSIPNDPGVNTS